MTTIPKPRSPDTGLNFYKAGNTWRAEFTDCGKRRYRSLKTPDLIEARARRDAFYAELRAAGATYPDRRMTVNPEDDRGITEVHGFVLKIHGKHIGHFPTLDAAREAKRSLAERGTP